MDKPLRADPGPRFWTKVEKSESCWVWIGARSDKGYGTFWDNTINKHIHVHRLSYEIHRGPIPRGLMVLHDCPSGDNRACINPDHLWTGTARDNTQDMIKKGRDKFPQGMPGEANPAAKLTAADVADIRKRLNEGETMRSIARSFSVARGTIAFIKTGVTWIGVAAAI